MIHRQGRQAMQDGGSNFGGFFRIYIGVRPIPSLAADPKNARHMCGGLTARQQSTDEGEGPVCPGEDGGDGVQKTPMLLMMLKGGLPLDRCGRLWGCWRRHRAAQSAGALPGGPCAGPIRCARGSGSPGRAPAPADQRHGEPPKRRPWGPPPLLSPPAPRLLCCLLSILNTAGRSIGWQTSSCCQILKSRAVVFTSLQALSRPGVLNMCLVQ